jgi:hypothetical protein
MSRLSSKKRQEKYGRACAFFEFRYARNQSDEGEVSGCGAMRASRAGAMHPWPDIQWARHIGKDPDFANVARPGAEANSEGAEADLQIFQVIRINNYRLIRGCPFYREMAKA